MTQKPSSSQAGPLSLLLLILFLPLGGAVFLLATARGGIESVRAGAGGEIQLTDALQIQAKPTMMTPEGGGGGGGGAAILPLLYAALNWAVRSR